MGYADKIITSLYGRRLGLQIMTTAITGGRLAASFLVGSGLNETRLENSTAEATGTNLLAWGISRVAGSSADSSSVFVLDPPIPGIPKTLFFPSTGNTGCYVKTKNSETFQTTLGSSHTVLKSTIGGMVHLTGMTTAIWAAIGITSGTSSQAGGFSLTTTT